MGSHTDLVDFAKRTLGMSAVDIGFGTGVGDVGIATTSGYSASLVDCCKGVFGRRNGGDTRGTAGWAPCPPKAVAGYP